MKTALYVSLFAASSMLLGGGADVVKLGNETDYVGTALNGLGKASVGATGSYSPIKDIRGFHGWQIRKLREHEWDSAPSLILTNLEEALASDHWKVHAPNSFVPANSSAAVSLVVDATRGNEMLEALITIFPASEGVTRIAYWERRSLLAPNQLPDPTSPSVTPAAGAAGAPSVAADH
jgi:hypothetical protein